MLDPLAQRVLRFHYGDGLTLGQLERTFHVDRATLEAVRSGIREVLAQLAVEHPAERPIQTDDESDLVLTRIATMTSGRCPGPMGLASEEGRNHAERCARCAHALRLIRRGALSPNNLFVPDGPVVPPSQVGVVALVLHPDAHRHKKLVAKALGELAIPAGADAWLFDAKDQQPIEAALRALCELGTPPRYHLRAARVVGEGRWRRGVVLGPLPHASLAAARAALWSELDGFEALPGSPASAAACARIVAARRHGPCHRRRRRCDGAHARRGPPRVPDRRDLQRRTKADWSPISTPTISRRSTWSWSATRARS